MEGVKVDIRDSPHFPFDFTGKASIGAVSESRPLKAGCRPDAACEPGPWVVAGGMMPLGIRRTTHD